MLRNLRRQTGSMLITASIWLIMLIGMTALAFDVGHLLIVRNELQNAADAAALAGANCLDKTTAGSGTDCTTVKSASLNWSIANTKALNSIGLNQSDGTGLVNGTVETGYWNINGGTILQPSSLTPLGPCTMVAGVMTTACDKPAVRVTLSRSAGSNGGPVGTLIATMFGAVETSISTRAVAVISSPGSVTPGSMIPTAINKCMFDQFWDSTTGSPKIYTGSPVDPYGLSTIGQPWEFRVGSAYHYATCYSGQWTSFGLDQNSASDIKNLINNGNATQLSIGDNTWIEPGTKVSNYNDLDAKYPTPPGADVTMPVVDLASDLTTKGTAAIVAFAGFHITDIQGGSAKYIQGHFTNNITTGGSSGIGPYYGIYTPPRLAQ